MLNHLPNLHLTAIDPFEGYEDWGGYVSSEILQGREVTALRALESFSERFTFIKRYSDAALELLPDEAFDFVYVDGDHSYKWALHDMTNYWNKVKSGGVLCGHDRSLSGVAQALAEFGKDFTPSEEPQGDSWYIIKP
jgi:predicted O-methyltransferase YrrM